MNGESQIVDEIFLLPYQNSLNIFHSSEKIKVSNFWYDINIGWYTGKLWVALGEDILLLFIYFILPFNRNSIEMKLTLLLVKADS